MNLVFDILNSEMDRRNFTCGEPALDVYLHKQAKQDMKRGFATVITAKEEEHNKKIIGYYTLSAASILLTALPKEVTHKMPRYHSVPAIRLGRLAVDISKQRQHIGSLLIMDALRRSLVNELAWAIFIVDAKNERAATFYEKFLFKRFQDNHLTLWLHRNNVAELFS